MSERTPARRGHTRWAKHAWEGKPRHARPACVRCAALYAATNVGSSQVVRPSSVPLSVARRTLACRMLSVSRGMHQSAAGRCVVHVGARLRQWCLLTAIARDLQQLRRVVRGERALQPRQPGFCPGGLSVAIARHRAHPAAGLARLVRARTVERVGRR